MMKVWNEEELIQTNLKQWYDVPIDAIYLFDEGCTDNTIPLAKEILKNLKCKTAVIGLSTPHEEYFYRCQEDEFKHFNRMIEILSHYNWIIKLDTDEIFSSNVRYIVNQLKNCEVPFNAVYSEIFELMPGLDKYVSKADNSNFTHDIHRLQIRTFNPRHWYYPNLETQDTWLHPKSNESKAAKFEGYNLFHLKSLMPSRRSIRGKSLSEQPDPEPWINPEFRPMPRSDIPDMLVEWYNKK